MLNVGDVHSLDQWQVIGQQAAHSLGSRRLSFLFWRRAQSRANRELQKFLQLVYDTDPKDFSEDQFVRAEAILNDVINSTQTYLTAHVDHNDTDQFCCLGEAIRRLRDARHWIMQGLSPDPSKRPSEDERRRRADAHAATVWRDLVS